MFDWAFAPWKTKNKKAMQVICFMAYGLVMQNSVRLYFTEFPADYEI
jgi:hypothetical protein